MAEITPKGAGEADHTVTPLPGGIDSLSDTASKDHSDSPEDKSSNAGLTFARRGEQVGESLADGDVDGFDAARMRDRALLTADEEKALLRRIDWRMMSLCSIIFMMKQLDTDNISNARIMNRDTDRNIMTELGMSSDQYNLLTVLYYVSASYFFLD